MMLSLLLALAHAAPPARALDTTRYIVWNHGFEAGDLVVRRTADSIIVRFIFTDRNRGTRTENRYKLGPKGDVIGGETRPILADGSAGAAITTFGVSGDSLRFVSSAGGRGGPPQARVAKLEPNAYFGFPFASPFEASMLVRHVLAQPNRTTKLLPSGQTIRAEVVGETDVRTKSGRSHVRLVMTFSQGNNTPSGVWIDEKGELFASDVQWFMPVRTGGEEALPALRALETKWRNAQAEGTSAKLGAPPSAQATVVIRNADVFDSERAVILPRTTIVIAGDRITAVGPADQVATPAGARVIDATGKTVTPGLWEMHGHSALQTQSGASMMQLAQGITTVRDLAADLDVATSLRDRAATGKLASPRLVLAGFIEGPQRWAGPSEVRVSTEAQAREWVARYDSLGYKQVKLYNLVHPDLVPTIAQEAHKRGMRVSGHIPRGLSVPAAVLLGFDEVQHAAFLFSTFYQDSLYYPTMRAYSAVATAVAPNFDVDAQPMSELIAFLRDHHTVIDGTFSVWIGGTAIAQSVGAGVPTDQSKSDQAYLKLIRRLWDAGVTLVPGTDNGASTTYHRELQLYEQAGVPALKVLQLATIGSARVMKDDRDYGSIAVGKVADVSIFNGKPGERLSELNRIETVIRAGRVYSVADLMFEATGRRPTTP